MTIKAESPVASPCNSVCTMDERSGWCRGCARTLDEIAAWSTLADADKVAVLGRLPQRRAALAAAGTAIDAGTPSR